MKILITGLSMSYLSGQPLYCYELALELKRQGHEVEVRSQWAGNMRGNEGYKLFENLCKAGIRCAGWDSTWLRKDFDLWIASEIESERICKEIPSVPMINVVHSEYECETPIHDKPFAYVCIRPEIIEHIVKKHNISREKCHLIYNGIDRKRFKKIRKPKRNYKLIVVPCTLDTMREKFLNHLIDTSNKKRHVHFYGFDCGAKLLDSEFIKILPDTFNIEKPIGEADEVAGVLLGRVNLEAMSCGVPSRIYDPKTLENYPFVITEKEFDKRHNIKYVAQQILTIKRPETIINITIVIPHHDQHQRLADILNDLDDIKNIVIVKGGTFAQNCNRGFQLVKTKYVLFLNDDTRIKDAKGLFSHMLKKAMECDIIGCRVSGDDKVNGVKIVDKKMMPILNSKDKVDMPAGVCLLMQAKTFKKLGGYDTAFRNGCEDGDLYMRAWEMKMKIGVVKDTIQHLQCQSTGRFDYADENVILYNKRWGNKAKDLHLERIKEAKKKTIIKKEKSDWINI
jgi:hypothetical protein